MYIHEIDLLVGVVLVDGELDRQIGGAGLAVDVGDAEVGERELGAVRAEAEPEHEEDDAGDEDEREQHRAEEVEAPDRRALPVVRRQAVVPRHGWSIDRRLCCTCAVRDTGWCA